jgi:transposase
MQPRELRYRAVVHYKHFLPSLRKVALLYNISKSSLQRWIHHDPAVRKPRSKKSTDASIKKCVRDVIQDNPFATWAMIAETLSHRCHLKASRTTAGRLLKREGFTRKKACRVVDKTHDAATVLSF